MSFTQDELQAFDTILEQKLAIQRREMEQVFEQHMQVLRRELDQRITTAQQDLLRELPIRLPDQQHRIGDVFSELLNTQQARLESLQHRLDTWQQQQRQQIEEVVENALAAQLLAIEQLINQRDSAPSYETNSIDKQEAESSFVGLEVQAEITWEDLIGSVDKAIDHRFSALYESLQTLLKNTERYLVELLRQLREELASRGASFSSAGTITNVQDMFTSIEQLERIIESMQVAMTANHALLSNRLYHHQQLPLERAHPTSQSVTANSQLSHPKNEKSTQE